jgi:hypothetical protein
MNNSAVDPIYLPHEIDYSDARTYKAFNNQFPNGKLRQLFNDPSYKGNLEFFVDEIETMVEYMFLGLGNKRGRNQIQVR